MSTGESLINEEWVRQELKKIQGEVLFPRWQAKRRGAHKYEVLFTYTVLSSDYSIVKCGYSWMADLLLGLVGPARMLEEEDMSRNTIRRPSSGATNEDYGLRIE